MLEGDSLLDSNRVEERLKSAESFLEIARYLDSGPPVRVPLGSPTTVVEEIKGRHRWWSGITCHMLYAIVFEIAVKIIWELDNQRTCRYTHDISSLYRELSEKSQQEIRKTFDAKSVALSQLEGTNKKGKRIRLGEIVRLQSLEDALEANEDVMKNFKYETRFNGKSSVMGSVIWSDELVWMLPPMNDRFPDALFRYTVDRVKEAGLE